MADWHPHSHSAHFLRAARLHLIQVTALAEAHSSALATTALQPANGCRAFCFPLMAGVTRLPPHRPKERVYGAAHSPDIRRRLCVRSFALRRSPTPEITGGRAAGPPAAGIGSGALGTMRPTAAAATERVHVLRADHVTRPFFTGGNRENPSLFRSQFSVHRLSRPIRKVLSPPWKRIKLPCNILEASL